MASIYSQAILLLTVACMSTVSSAHRGWFWGYNCTWPFKHGHKSPLPPPPPSPPPPPPPSPPPPPPSPPPPSPPPPLPQQSSRKIIVGGSEHWRFGFDYNDWALKNGPFYLNDILVFKYDPPTSALPHSVYSLSNIRSFSNCDLRRAQKLGNSTQGGGDGFEFVLKQRKPYYFACGEGNGFHCRNGTMKFFVTPKVRGRF